LGGAEGLASEFDVPFGVVAIGCSEFGKAFEFQVDLDMTGAEAFGTVSAAPQLLQAARRPA
jgi:hypothetical protein